MIAITLSAFVLAAPVPKSEMANSKATLAVLADLGLSDTFGKLSDVPGDYRITAEELKAVRVNPEEHPLRAVILKAGEAVAKCRGASVQMELRATDWKTATVLARREQKAAADRIIELEESFERLQALEKFAGKEQNPRWRAHHDLLYALLEAEIVRTHEYNAALALIVTERLPEDTFEPGTTGLRLVPDAKMKSRKHIRDMAKDSAERFEQLTQDRRGTPWGELAEKLAAIPTGYKLERVKAEN
jgi:hypothetical protein